MIREKHRRLTCRIARRPKTTSCSARSRASVQHRPIMGARGYISFEVRRFHASISRICYIPPLTSLAEFIPDVRSCSDRILDGPLPAEQFKTSRRSCGANYLQTIARANLEGRNTDTTDPTRGRCGGLKVLGVSACLISVDCEKRRYVSENMSGTDHQSDNPQAASRR